MGGLPFGRQKRGVCYKNNRGYDPAQVVKSFWVNVWLGGVRFSHTAIVRFDEALKDIFGWKRIPCVSTYTRFFKKFGREAAGNVFGSINKWFFEQMPAQTFTVGLDSSTGNLLIIWKANACHISPLSV